MTEKRDDSPSLISFRWNWKWVIQWTILFVCNLILPFWLGISATNRGGRYGMVAGIVVLWGMGLPICYLSKDFRRSILIGGTILACFQFFPFGHALIVMFAYSTWTRITGLEVNTSDFGAELSGFGTTILTGQILLALSAGSIHAIHVINRLSLGSCETNNSKKG